MEKLFTKKEVAKYLQISERTVVRIVQDFDIPFVLIKTTASKRALIRIPASSVKLMLTKPLNDEERDKIINNIYEV